jgi:phosphoribosylformylglycinamidine cyclo-ligase
MQIVHSTADSWTDEIRAVMIRDMNASTYKSAGVDLETYQQSMQRLPDLIRRTHDAQKGKVLDLPGGFAGLFRLFGDGTKLNDPVLVSGSDGVGTKIKVAQLADRYDTIGIDLVAMCVNDCLCIGAEPLFFLDYLAFAKDDPDMVEALVRGVSDGCLQAGAALLGGETAVMPGLYQPGDFDMAGFCVGVIERDKLIDGSKIKPGDVLLGIPSSGLHSNGYSLIRNIVFDQAGLKIDDHIPELNRTVAEVLLTPTQIYAELVSSIMHSEHAAAVTGIAHITGGGLQENVDRVLPEGCKAEIDRSTWTVPPEFQWLQKLGNVDLEEMFRVFNMGIGLVMIVNAENASSIREQHPTAIPLGTVKSA